MKQLARIRLDEWGVLLLLAFSILWKGGKSLEATWLLAGVASVLTLIYWAARSLYKRDDDRQLEIRQGISQRVELPVSLWVVVLAYILWGIMAYIFSETKNYGLDEIFRSTGYMLLFLWIARRQIEQESRIDIWYPHVMTWVTAIACVIGTLVYTLQPVDRFVGTFFDYRFHTDFWPNAWAEYLLIAWPMILLLTWKQRKEKSRWALFLLLGYVLSCLLLSYSRGALLSLIGQIVMMTVLFFSVVIRDIRYSRHWKHITRSVFVKTIFVLAISMILFAGINELRSLSFPVQSVIDKATFNAAEGKSSINERAQFWGQAQEFALEKPVIGWGPYSFRFLQPSALEHVLATSDHPHNIQLKLAMERGFPAVILFSVIFGGVLGLAVLSFFTTRKSHNPQSDALIITSITGIVGILLHNFIDYNLQFTAIGTATVITLALLVFPATPVAQEATMSFRRWRVRRFLSRIDILLSLLLLAVLCWEGIFLITSSIGRHAMAAGDAQTALRWFERSHPALLSRDLYLSEAQLWLQEKQDDKAMIAVDRYIALNAHDARGWKVRGEILLHAGKAEEAVQSLEKAYARGAYTDLGITRLLLEAIRASAQTENIAARKLTFDKLFTDYADAIEQNTHFIALSQNVEELQKTARLLGLLYPVDAERYVVIARKAAAHAREERDRFSSRRQGMLW